MLPKINLSLTFISLLLLANLSGISQANINLSNLSATAVNTDLLPGTDNARSFGSSTKAWKQLYVNNLIFMGGSRFITYGNSIGLQGTGVGSFALAGNTTGTNNSAFGAYALRSNTTGFNNVAVGYTSLFKSAAGHNNVAVGTAAMYNNTSGVSNSAMGNSALTSNTVGNNNMAIGANALGSNTSGDGNVGIGVRALFSNKSTNHNVAIGDSAAFSLTSGNGENVAVGYLAMLQNAAGDYNVALGPKSLYSNQTGSANIAIGRVSLFTNTTGNSNIAVGISALALNSSGTYNTAIGQNAMYFNNAGYQNMAAGYQSLYGNTSGHDNVALGFNTMTANRGDLASFNTAIGNLSLTATTNSEYNTAIGYNTATAHDLGYNNVFVGANCDGGSDGLYNVIAIGQGVVVNGSSQARIGNTATVSIGGAVNWTKVSDGRFKKNIKSDVAGLDFIKKLNAVTYTLDAGALDEHLHRGMKRIPNASQDKAVADKEKIIESGFIAQDVEKAARESGYEFSGVDKPQTADGVYGLRYADFVVPLVRAVQQLDSGDAKKSKVDSMSHVIDSLVDGMSVLQARLARLESMMHLAGGVSLSDASLGQNTPNPVRGSTTISYRLPQSYGRAKIQITDMNGRVLRTIPVTGNGEATLSVNTSSLSAGSYPYALYVDGAMVGSKQMLVVK